MNAKPVPVPEWRTDPITGRQVIISPIRAERPFLADGFCPFCEHNETETTPESYAIRTTGTPPDGPGWQIRVIPNKYAAVKPDAVATHDGQRVAPGIAEVIIEGPTHETHLHRQSPLIVKSLVRVWRDRLAFWRADGRYAYAQVFKNQGAKAGASLSHSHSQLIAVTDVPPQVEAEITRLCNFDWHAWQEAERHGPRRIIETAELLAVCPIAARFPGEMWIIPKQVSPRFETLTAEQCDAVAELLHELLKRLDKTFHSPDFNIIVKSAPFHFEADQFCWRIEILPRLVTAAGWEYATDVLINPLPPEQAAEMLRQT